LPINALNAEKLINKICTNMRFLVPPDKIKQPIISNGKKFNQKINSKKWNAMKKQNKIEEERITN
jgi:hypothetical protein